MEIKRKKDLEGLKRRYASSPAVAILGPRQCGKTTLARQFVKKYLGSIPVHHFDLEKPEDLSRLEHPMTALESLQGLIVIDEIQRRPDLFPILRVLIDENPKLKFLILGSASQELLAQSSESLAGRISYYELGGFNLGALPVQSEKQLWMRGGFPRSFLARREEDSFQWRQDFITTFLEKDIPNLGIRVPSYTLRRFWTMLAHYHGQIFQASEIGKSLGVADTTVRHYLDILTGTFLIRELRPWFYNTKKRLVKRPKIYFRDSGLFHSLLTVKNYSELISHAKLGASWEGFAVEQVIQHFGLKQDEVFFWSTHNGAELDLVFQQRGKLWGVEVKYGDAPKITPSMISAISDLSLEHLWVVYPGKENYQLDKKNSVVSINHISKMHLNL